MGFTVKLGVFLYILFSIYIVIRKNTK